MLSDPLSGLSGIVFQRWRAAHLGEATQRTQRVFMCTALLLKIDRVKIASVFQRAEICLLLCSRSRRKK